MVRSQIIKDFFKKNPSIQQTAQDIAKKFSITRESASRHLNKLEKEKFLEKDESKPRNFWLSNHHKPSQLPSQPSQLPSQPSQLPSQPSQSYENDVRPAEVEALDFEPEYPMLQKEAKEWEELEESLQIAKETVINQNEEIQDLQQEIRYLKEHRKRPFTETQFSEFMLSKARKTGSNSYSIGEKKFRRSDLKNIYLIILFLREEDML